MIFFYDKGIFIQENGFEIVSAKLNIPDINDRSLNVKYGKL